MCADLCAQDMRLPRLSPASSFMVRTTAFCHTFVFIFECAFVFGYVFLCCLCFCGRLLCSFVCACVCLFLCVRTCVSACARVCLCGDVYVVCVSFLQVDGARLHSFPMCTYLIRRLWLGPRCVARGRAGAASDPVPDRLTRLPGVCRDGITAWLLSKLSRHGRCVRRRHCAAGSVTFLQLFMFGGCSGDLGSEKGSHVQVRKRAKANCVSWD